ncbi:MAG: DUF4214 domain-containing protein [Clostridiales bacterium]|nr:DUF4214 domain-containing protein [Clostridiales bacterium]
MKKWMFRLVVIVCLLFGATGINTTAQAAEAWAGEDGVAGFVTRMYQTCLGREPDAAGLNDWVTRLKAGESKGADIAFGFIFSAEFSNMNLCNSCYVDASYQAFFGRAADEAGKADWLSRLAQGQTRGAVMTGFLNSAEFSQLCDSYGIHAGSGDWSRDSIPVRGNCANCNAVNDTIADFVARLYTICLEREADEAGLNDWTNRLANGEQGSRVAYGFVFSQEYQEKHVSNEDFVTMLYRTMLDREPDAAGLADWTNKLDYTNTREFVFNGFLFSPEFRLRCAACGIHVGDVIETLDNTAEWQMNVEILALCNEERAANGLPALKTRQDLWEQVAMLRANECVSYFSHTRPNGTSCYTAYDEAGIAYWAVGENIASGYANAKAVVRGWMNSQGHRANILDTDFTYLATGYVSANRCYSQNFARFR